jgi:hypothetical protein
VNAKRARLERHRSAFFIKDFSPFDFKVQGYWIQQQLSCQSKSEESCCWVCTLEHVFGKVDSTFVATQSAEPRKKG